MPWKTKFHQTYTSYDTNKIHRDAFLSSVMWQTLDNKKDLRIVIPIIHVSFPIDG